MVVATGVDKISDIEFITSSLPYLSYEVLREYGVSYESPHQKTVQTHRCKVW